MHCHAINPLANIVSVSSYYSIQSPLYAHHPHTARREERHRHHLERTNVMFVDINMPPWRVASTIHRARPPKQRSRPSPPKLVKFPSGQNLARLSNGGVEAAMEEAAAAVAMRVQGDMETDPLLLLGGSHRVEVAMGAAAAISLSACGARDSKINPLLPGGSQIVMEAVTKAARTNLRDGCPGGSRRAVAAAAMEKAAAMTSPGGSRHQYPRHNVRRHAG
mmetsp:Transcript_417/g.954  ORF Transcript_417/g.954 Transcript_417/m.954 type:complete len:220 (+) Transcript_417:207-866(+)